MIDRKLMRRLDGMLASSTDGKNWIDSPGDASLNGEISPEMDMPVIVVDDEDEIPGEDDAILMLKDEEDDPEMQRVIILRDEQENPELEDKGTDEIEVVVELDEIKREAFEAGRDEGFANGK